LGLGLLKLLLVCFFLGGCATQKDVSLLQRQIWTARRDLDKSKAQMADIEKTLDEKLAALDADRQPLRKNQAEVGAQLDRIELELGQLTGQMEEATAMYTRNGERISEVQQNQMESMLEIRKNVEDLQRALNTMAGYLGLQELAVSSKPSSQKLPRLSPLLTPDKLPTSSQPQVLKNIMTTPFSYFAVASTTQQEMNSRAISKDIQSPTWPTTPNSGWASAIMRRRVMGKP